MKCEEWQDLILEREQLEPDEQRELGQHLSSPLGDPPAQPGRQ
jgi:hypothetical protein